MSQSVTEKVVHAFITSRLDSCNALLCGSSHGLLHRLQRVQNSAARLVTLARKRSHITPVLKELHWLPVQQRVQYKVLLLAYKALKGLAPEYLSELLTVYQPRRNLRSCESQQLVIPRTSMITCGDRAFRKQAPFLWNQLPLDVKQASSTEQFKQRLKTHLFKIAFSDM